jgi:hypothetical protein
MSDEMKSVISDRQYYKYTELAERHKTEGDFAVFEMGKFVDKQKNTFQTDKFDYIFEVGEKEHVLNTCGHLNFQMSKIPVGSIVTPIYKGKKLLEDGKMKGKEAHQWEVKFKAPATTPEPAQDVAEEDIPF